MVSTHFKEPVGTNTLVNTCCAHCKPAGNTRNDFRPEARVADVCSRVTQTPRVRLTQRRFIYTQMRLLVRPPCPKHEREGCQWEQGYRKHKVESYQLIRTQGCSDLLLRYRLCRYFICPKRSHTGWSAARLTCSSPSQYLASECQPDH